MTYVCAFSAAAMSGLVWFVQVVHYPLFASVGADAFAAYHRLHTQRTGWVVAPLMVAELLSAAGIALQRGGPLAWTGLALGASTWLLTFTLAVPLHSRLTRSYDLRVVRKLVRVNLLRAFAWTAHAGVALALVQP